MATTEMRQRKPVSKEGGSGSSTKLKPVVSIETVTPAQALQWLKEADALVKDGAPLNRRLSSNSAASYARDMDEGRFQISNDAICFDVDGRLINGQHRLQACCLSGKPFETLILRNMPRETQDVMDQGRLRKASDVLTLRGYVSSTVLAGAARRLLEFKDPRDSYTGNTVRSSRVSNAEVMDVIRRHPKLVDSVQAIHSGSVSPRGIPTTLLVAIHYVAVNLLGEAEKADAFVQVFVTGIPTYKGDPAHKLREKIIMQSRRSTRMTTLAMVYSGIRAWNGFRAGETVSKFQVPRNPVSINGLERDMI